MNIRVQPNFRNKLLISVLIASLTPVLIVGYFSYKKSSSLLEQRVESAMTQSLDQVAGYLSNRFKQIQNVSVLLMNDAGIQQMLMNSDRKSLYDQLQDYSMLKKTIQSLEENFGLLRIRLYLKGQPIYADEEVNFHTMYELSSVTNFNYEIAYNSGLHWKSTYPQTYSLNQTFQIISAYWSIKNITNPAEPVGVFFIDIPERELYRAISGIGADKGFNTFILDQQGSIISHSIQKLIGLPWKSAYSDQVTLMTNGSLIYNNQLVVVKTIPETGWKIVSEIPLSSIVSESKPIRDFTIYMLIITAIIVSCLAIILSKSLTRRIKQLVKVMASNYQGGDRELLQEAKVPSDVKVGDEIDQLIVSYNKMVRRVHGLVNEVYLIRLEESDARFKALQSQINPHFLYNTLDSIRVCLDRQKNQIASDMIISLSRFFRLSLSKGADKIPIAKELGMIREYLFILQMNYGNKIEWEITADPNTEPFLITRFTLQPIVENALQHGLNARREKGKIHIGVRILDDFIVIEVQDNGVGIDPDTLVGLQSLLESGNFSTKSYGLANVNARLKLHFGKECGIYLSSEHRHGTTVTVLIKQEIDLPD